MAEFYVDGDKCKSFEIAIKKITQIRKADSPIYLIGKFHNGDSIPLSVKRVGDRFEFDSATAALILDELLTESFYQSKKEHPMWNHENSQRQREIADILLNDGLLNLPV